VVARRAHNPEVVGSNPTPATNFSSPVRFEVDVNVMVRRILTAFLFGPLALLVSCASTAGIPATPGVIPVIPLIDTRTPAYFETATFALG
jgi:hypothetical protein